MLSSNSKRQTHKHAYAHCGPRPDHWLDPSALSNWLTGGPCHVHALDITVSRPHQRIMAIQDGSN